MCKKNYCSARNLLVSTTLSQTHSCKLLGTLWRRWLLAISAGSASCRFFSAAHPRIPFSVAEGSRDVGIDGIPPVNSPTL